MFLFYVRPCVTAQLTLSHLIHTAFPSFSCHLIGAVGQPASHSCGVQCKDLCSFQLVNLPHNLRGTAYVLFQRPFHPYKNSRHMLLTEILYIVSFFPIFKRKCLKTMPQTNSTPLNFVKLDRRVIGLLYNHCHWATR